MERLTKIIALIVLGTTLFCGITACSVESADSSSLFAAIAIESQNNQEETARKDATFDRLAVITRSAKTSYYIGEAFDKTGIEVHEVYQSGRAVDVTENVTFSGFDSSASAAKLPITVTYDDKTATFNISIVEIKSISITKDPVKRYYYIDDTFDGTGMVVTATLADGTEREIPSTACTTNFASLATSAGIRPVIITFNGKSTLLLVYVINKATTDYQFTETPVLLNATYYKFGDWPQTIKADDVTVDETRGFYRGAIVYFIGSDGYYYQKFREGVWDTTTVCYYSNGKKVAKSTDNSFQYFKVEPIIWRCVDAEKKLLVAESILAGSIPYYDNNYSYKTRSIGADTKIYPNNYKYSQIRASLNGLDYYNNSNKAVSDYRDRGFFQSAFTTTAQNKIATTEVDNSAASTAQITGYTRQAPEYACANTSDKIFLLSKYEVTKYGNGSYGNTKYPTDFAKATAAYAETGKGGWWWLRSPHYENSDIASYVHDCGSCSANWVHQTWVGVVPALCLSEW